MNDNITDRRSRTTTRLRRYRAGVTLIELLVTFGLFILVLTLVMSIADETRLGFRRGTVNLQNLHEARLALSILRRDFLAAVPILAPQDSPAVRQQIRRQPVVATVGGTFAHRSEPILVTPHELSFSVVTGFDSTENPLLEPVRYVYSARNQLLQRITSKHTMSFQGIRTLQFSLLAHAASSQAPRVWVAMEVQRETSPGQPAPILSVGTLLTARTAADMTQHPAWNPVEVVP